MLKTSMGILRVLAYGEGISFVLLIGVCMPMKYTLGITGPMFPVGLTHGLLFMGYCIWALMVWREYKKPFSFLVWAVIAALLPFGTFVADKKLFRNP
jgi:integral membrane protein